MHKLNDALYFSVLHRLDLMFDCIHLLCIGANSQHWVLIDQVEHILIVEPLVTIVCHDIYCVDSSGP